MVTIPANTDENKTLICKNSWKVIMVIVRILNLWIQFFYQVYSESFKYEHLPVEFYFSCLDLHFLKWLFILFLVCAGRSLARVGSAEATVTAEHRL